ncbi:MAG TPA: hypothetical protein VKJ07_18305, partial [Mycobacteriales bacterium]|nr:hypothetical protein [Mycobacteriales bacterium]
MTAGQANTSCVFVNNARGQVVVTKNTTGGNGTFVFTLSNGVTMTATISTSGTTIAGTVVGSGSATFTGLAPGTYTVSESANADFTPVGSTTCTAIVGPGASIGCTFANAAKGSVVVTKNTTGGNGSFVFTLSNGVTMTATISTSGTTIAGSGSATFTGLAPGTYTVSESANADFAPVGPTTCTAIVGPGASIGCTFANAARGSVLVTKNTTGGNGTFVFTLSNGVTMTATISTSGTTIAGTVVGSGTATFTGLAPGTYTVSESANADFTPVGSTTCTAVVGPGASTTCSFTNQARGSVVVTKNTTGGNGSFVFTLSNGVTMTATISTSGTTVAGS